MEAIDILEAEVFYHNCSPYSPFCIRSAWSCSCYYFFRCLMSSWTTIYRLPVQHETLQTSVKRISPTDGSTGEVLRDSTLLYRSHTGVAWAFRFVCAFAYVPLQACTPEYIPLMFQHYNKFSIWWGIKTLRLSNQQPTSNAVHVHARCEAQPPDGLRTTMILFDDDYCYWGEESIVRDPWNLLPAHIISLLISVASIRIPKPDQHVRWSKKEHQVTTRPHHLQHKHRSYEVGSPDGLGNIMIVLNLFFFYLGGIGFVVEDPWLLRFDWPYSLFNGCCLCCLPSYWHSMSIGSYIYTVYGIIEPSLNIQIGSRKNLLDCEFYGHEPFS